MKYDLGPYTCPVTTSSSDAQAWFDQGLLWTYGYNHEEAVTCFEAAAAADETCAMAHWGIAYAIGPNYNRAWETYELDEKAEVLARALGALERAKVHAASATAAEQGLIEALATRYPNDAATEDFGPWDDAFADAMRGVHKRHPDNLEICTVFAEAMMNRTPWALWDLKSGSVADGADTTEIISVIETALDQVEGAWDHAGLLHLYVHVMEMSPHPEKALRHGDRLRQLVPDAGHLLHMPTHIDVLCGEYQNVVDRNGEAIVANRRYYVHRGADNFYSFYRAHDYHFRVYGAMFLGQHSVALQAADEMVETLPESVIRSLADFLECYVSVKQHVQIRFGQWQEILDTALPEDTELYCYTLAILRYARTVALANLGRMGEADAEAELFRQAGAAVPESRAVITNTAKDVLQVAEQMMLGELAYHKGEHEKAFEHLRQSVHLDDNLAYDEPWGWMQPTRHALGALLLEQGRYEEAEAVYRADLGLDATLSRACQHPNNVWSLHGLYECLQRRGETVEAPHIKQQLDRAVARAEVPIRSSCYCRKAAA
ncbi:MAG: tetratricopeptide repeat protein [Pseudomonadota bacterium]